ncbi:RxLR effector protein, partial [Phytophthora megakarya]
MRLIYIILLCIYGVQSEFITNIKTTPKINHPKIALTGDSVATTITRRFLRIYNEDDDERAYGIQSIPGIGKVSTYLYNQKLAKTLKKNDQDIDTIFSKLGLNTAGEKLLQHPNFFIWVKYVDDYNRKNGKTLSMLPTLRRQYKDEVLIKMFEAATQVERTKHIATILQTEQMRIWKES